MNKVSFVVPGHPVGYVRMTQAQVRLLKVHPSKLNHSTYLLRKKIKAYLAYKDLVAYTALSVRSKHPRSPGYNEKCMVNIKMFFKNGVHSDPDNVQKAIKDALFENDKYIGGSYNPPAYDAENPRVEVEITWL